VKIVESSKSRLAVEIKLGGPPRGCTVFELHPEGMEIVTGALSAKSREIFDFKIAGLFQ
jgi:hypothetical protein